MRSELRKWRADLAQHRISALMPVVIVEQAGERVEHRSIANLPFRVHQRRGHRSHGDENREHGEDKIG